MAAVGRSDRGSRCELAENRKPTRHLSGRGAITLVLQRQLVMILVACLYRLAQGVADHVCGMYVAGGEGRELAPFPVRIRCAMAAWLVAMLQRRST